MNNDWFTDGEFSKCPLKRKSEACASDSFQIIHNSTMPSSGDLSFLQTYINDTFSGVETCQCPPRATYLFYDTLCERPISRASQISFCTSTIIPVQTSLNNIKI